MKVDIRDAQDLLVKAIRRREEASVANDYERLEKLRALEETPDDYLLKKTAWSLLFFSAPLAFLILPLVLGLVDKYLPAQTSQLLWFSAKSFMAVVLLSFLFSIYLTFKEKSSY
ncbi:MAG: hypothetical protein K2Y32_09560 [Candidatus Obscuribacterales bacterium]|nr:hypothetical protein [Candidatus Obscuribacterales bacterium]